MIGRGRSPASGGVRLSKYARKFRLHRAMCAFGRNPGGKCSEWDFVANKRRDRHYLEVTLSHFYSGSEVDSWVLIHRSCKGRCNGTQCIMVAGRIVLLSVSSKSSKSIGLVTKSNAPRFIAARIFSMSPYADTMMVYFNSSASCNC
jgi:hypothetical protein